ncbi:MAG: 2-isopropylmalate synthase [Candidatus Omnitrophica bacterium]|nr:2-isopropylmalate synthase [Candidatus Omnitrophota bacterium]MCM8798004.1 2-isopropylmalate synthase [Candidatus Omnitrophota bacterium]
MEKIIIFDTTLRDGEQAPGASLETKQKLEIAKQLEHLNVDIIEAGFPIASPGDFEAVTLIAREIKKPTICALSRSLKKDIDMAKEALRKAKHPRIHVFLATSKIHMQYKLRKVEEEVLQQAVEAVKYAKKFTPDVEFSPEDASRTQKEFLYRVLEAVIETGATTVNIPDTVGYAMPQQFGELIRLIKENVYNINKAVISVHCHNDLGLAVANSLSAIKNGARQVECTINGLGERAGNAAMEEIVMAIKTRHDFLPFTTAIKTTEIYKTSRLVSSLTGFVVQPNKAIVGANAFRHESGIHQDGILKEPRTYEIMSPEQIGLKISGLVLGKHSGRHAFNERLKKLGFRLNKEELERAFMRFKALADKKKEVFDEDIVAIIEDEIKQIPQTWSLEYLHIVSGTDTIPTATIRLRHKDKVIQDAASGDGPVDACYRAIERITGIKGELEDYAIKSVSKGREALGEVTIKLRYKGKLFTGRGATTDIIEASAKAYVNAINKIVYKR